VLHSGYACFKAIRRREPGVAMMDKDEYLRRQEEIARFAESEGVAHYDPDSPVVWKQYIIGPVPLWRRLLWSIFPPSHTKMRWSQQWCNDGTDC
jgi:hypothetical protein